MRRSSKWRMMDLWRELMRSKRIVKISDEDWENWTLSPRNSPKPLVQEKGQIHEHSHKYQDNDIPSPSTKREYKRLLQERIITELRCIYQRQWFTWAAKYNRLFHQRVEPRKRTAVDPKTKTNALHRDKSANTRIRSNIRAVDNLLHRKILSPTDSKHISHGN